MKLVKDKRLECGCHEETCGAVLHCIGHCRWPDCLTEDEHDELLAELERDGL